MTPEDSLLAHLDTGSKARIGEEVADVLLYLLQLADHSEINMAQAVKDKLVRNALRYPAKRTIARVSPVRASVPGTHVLLDYENVQPTEAELRAMVPDASQVWVFHGPHQRQVEQRFASFGSSATAVPISKTGKNALEFHLSFYMGYIASRNQASAIVVVANDKGYEPMLEHARAMGFSVRQLGHGPVRHAASVKAAPAAKAGASGKPTAKKVPANKAAAKQPAVKQVSAKKTTAKKVSPAPSATMAPTAKVATAKEAAPVKTVVAKPAIPPTAKVAAAPIPSVASRPSSAPVMSQPARSSTVSADEIKKITENLRKMGVNRPMKPASLRRLLKSLLVAETGDASIEVAFGKLGASGVVAVGAGSEVTYPAFDLQHSSVSTNP
jgi:hypothetical protein